MAKVAGFAEGLDVDMRGREKVDAKVFWLLGKNVIAIY